MRFIEVFRPGGVSRAEFLAQGKHVGAQLLRVLGWAIFPGSMFDATPVCWDGRVYAASRDGYLYCLE
jgi:hypothetical protein